MPRFALRIAYDGAPFAGWQRQRDLPTVQGAVEAALRRLEPDAPGIAAAGRTDAGVHALGQVAQCDLARDWDPFRLSGALNHHLKPAPVAVTAAARVDPDWHARFSAVERRYTFRLVARRAPVVHDRGLVWQVPHPLSLAAMRDGTRQLTGLHDFTTFRSTGCQALSPMKTLDRLEIDETGYSGGGQAFEFRLAARSFLHNQVRSIVGTLERVGAGAWSPDRVGVALAARDRAACGPVCPPQGLYLERVIYPDDVFSPER